LATVTRRDRDWSLPTVGVAVLSTAAVAVAPAPAGLPTDAQYALATMVFAAVLWISGALPLAVTAISIPLLLTLLGVYPGFEPALSGFADPIIFLFLGTFVLAGAMGKHDLDRRVALALVARVGTSPRRLVLGVMVTTAGLSMVISNTATSAMMAPIALGLVRQIADPPASAGGGTSDTPGTVGAPANSPAADPAADSRSTDASAPSSTGASDDPPTTAGDAPLSTTSDAPPSDAGTNSPGGRSGADLPAAGRDDAERSNLHVAMLLGTAYAASVGGVATLIGTPPNAIAVAQLGALGIEVSFVEWMVVGVPVAILTLPIVWYVLVRLYPPEARDVSAARARAWRRYRDLGPVDSAGRRTAAVFVAVAALWVLGGAGALFEGRLPPRVSATLYGGAPHLFGPGTHQGALYFALVGLLAAPALVLVGAADADDVAAIDWNTLLLFGGGISLADALVDTGATRWLADAVFGSLAGVPLFALLLAVVALTVLLSELASNTATVAILAPVLVEVGPRHAAAHGLGEIEAAALLVFTSAVAASYGFALPVATPPNAIVYGTGEIGREQMLRAGVTLDVILGLVTAGILLALGVVGLPGIA
jgi:sodium-dependent dicarboxylate transporter 2/3/5